SSQALLRAQQLEAIGELTDANIELARAQEILDAQPDLRADELRAEVRRRLSIVRQRLEEQAQRQRARQRNQDFWSAYSDALVYETLFTGLDMAANRDKTRSTARAALAVYGLDGEAEPAANAPAGLERDRPYLGAGEHGRLVGACYEMLLIWAEAEAASEPAPSNYRSSRLAAQKALTLLARAAWLGQIYGLDTRAYHFRKARYRAQGKGETFQPSQVAAAVPPKPTGMLDWFLEALDRYRAGQYEPALEACSEVLRQQEQHY